MASTRTPFINYYDVLTLLPDDPQLRANLVARQAAILANPGAPDNEKLLNMILTLLDPALGAAYNAELQAELALDAEMKAFTDFISDEDQLQVWLCRFVNNPGKDCGPLTPAETAAMQVDPIYFYLIKKFDSVPVATLCKKLLTMLAMDTVFTKNFFSAVTTRSDADRLEYIWDFLQTIFKNTMSVWKVEEFERITACLQDFILENKFNDLDGEPTSLVYPAPSSFQLLSKIFASSPLKHMEVMNRLINNEGFIATIKSYHKLSMHQRVKHATASHVKMDDPYVPALRECFEFLPDKGDTLGNLILDDAAQFKLFGTDESFWSNFSETIQKRMHVIAKHQSDAAIIHSNVKIKEYFEEIHQVLSDYHIKKIDAQAAREDGGVWSKARVSLFSREDSRGLSRVKMLIELFADAMNDPMRQLILALAVISNTDSKKLRGAVLEKVNKDAAMRLLTERMQLLHGAKTELNFPDLNTQVLNPINVKSNHPAVNQGTVLAYFQPEIEKIKQLEMLGTLQCSAEYKR